MKQLFVIAKAGAGILEYYAGQDICEPGEVYNWVTNVHKAFHLEKETDASYLINNIFINGVYQIFPYTV